VPTQVFSAIITITEDTLSAQQQKFVAALLALVSKHRRSGLADDPSIVVLTSFNPKTYQGVETYFVTWHFTDAQAATTFSTALNDDPAKVLSALGAQEVSDGGHSYTPPSDSKLQGWKIFLIVLACVIVVLVPIILVIRMRRRRNQAALGHAQLLPPGSM